MFSRSTFFKYQRTVLHHAVNTVWKQDQVNLLQHINSGLVLGGDSRCDSMGHCAKYGSYTLVDLNFKKILSIELVQVSDETTFTFLYSYFLVE